MADRRGRGGWGKGLNCTARLEKDEASRTPSRTNSHQACSTHTASSVTITIGQTTPHTTDGRQMGRPNFCGISLFGHSSTVDPDIILGGLKHDSTGDSDVLEQLEGDKSSRNSMTGIMPGNVANQQL